MKSILTTLFTLLTLCGWSQQRDIYNLNQSWLFVKEDVTNASLPNIDECGWQKVSLPHTYNDSDTFDDFCRGTHLGEENQFRGTVWYRKYFTLPESDANRRVFIEFEGVRQVATIFINGKELGVNRTGFIPFGYDLTPYLKFGEPNLLAVKCNNDRTKDSYSEVDRFISNPDNLIPWNHENWHPCHGGIYRNVTLTVTDDVYVTQPLYDNMQTVGAYIYDIENDESRAKVGVDSEIANMSSTTKEIELELTVKDAGGKSIASSRATKMALLAGDKKIITGSVEWQNPNRWEPAYPYLYTMEIKVIADGEQSDMLKIPFGVKSVEFTPHKGLYINSRYYKLHGWGHKPTQEWAGLGAAIQNWQREYTIKMMKDGGGNFIRWGHCAASPSESLMADKYGMVVMMPGVDGERDCIGDAWKIRAAAFRDLVVRYRNSPSIFVWEYGNYFISTEHARELKSYVDKYDPHGNRLCGSRMANNRMVDDISVELTTQALPPFFKDLPCIESEYLREESPRRVWDRVSPPNYGYLNGDNPGNKFNLTQEEYIAEAVDFWWKMGSKRWHNGGANWVFSDGTHGGRQVVEVTRNSGEVDAVRLPKEAYFAHKAMWSPELSVEIVGHWSYPEGTVKDIYAVSNTEQVELFVNGKSLGFGKRSSNHLFKWEDVRFEQGCISAIGYIGAESVCESSEITTGAPAAIRLTAITSDEGWRADGADVALVDVEIVDKDGNRCVCDEAPVEFTLTGEAEWRGGYNSGKENTTLKSTLDTECGINRVALRSTFTAGKVYLTAKRAGLPAATIKLRSSKTDFAEGLSTDMPAELNYSTKDYLPYRAYTTYDKIETERGGTGETKLFRNVSYTGSTPATLQTTFAEGTSLFADNIIYRLAKCPSILEGCELVRFPLNDGTMWARDLLLITPAKDITLFVAHYKGLTKPNWLKSWSKVEASIVARGIDGEFDLYQTTLKKDETYTIDGNLPQADATEFAPQFIMFAK